MATTIKLKNGSGAPTAGQLVQGEPALDLVNKRLYTEDSGGTVIEVGTNPTSLTVNGATTIEATTPVLLLSSPEQTWSGGENLGGVDWYTRDTSGVAPATVASITTLSSGSNTLPVTDMYFKTSPADATPKNRMLISGIGDISFYEDTGTTAKFFWDASAESLGIGTTSPATLIEASGSSTSVTTGISSPLGLTLRNTDTTNGNYTTIQNRDGNGDQNAELKFINVSHAGNQGAIAFTTRSATGEFAEKMRIDSSGNVALTGNEQELLFHSNYTVGNTDRAKIKVIGAGGGSGFGGDLTFHTKNPSNVYSERMRIDSSGNLLVGTTEANLHTSSTEQGSRIGDGNVITSGNGTCGYFNRITTDGTILDFRKDGSTVGSIGVGDSDNLYITGGSGSTKGLIFTDDRIIAGANGYNFQDNNTDLGHPSYRFKDLYLSGGVYLGGTGAANHLDDYEEGEFDVVLTPETSGSIAIYGTHNRMAYTKIGRAVTVTGRVIVSGISSPVGSWFSITSLPFTVANVTDGAEVVGGAAMYYDWSSATYSTIPYRIDGASATVYVFYNPASLGSDDQIAFTFTYYTT